MKKEISGKKIAIFGGSGFIGSHLVNHLCKYSCQIDIVTRGNSKKLDFFLGSEPGQVRVVNLKEFSKESLDSVLNGVDIIFNLIGILYETKKNSFEKVHVSILSEIASSAVRNGVRGFIHLSALNIDKTKESSYARSKLKGEDSLKSKFPNCVIVRPSVVFGKRDNFTNLFSNLSNFSPFLPLIGTPEIKIKGIVPTVNFKKRVKFQPVYVGDLVTFLIAICSQRKKTFDLAGPLVQSFDSIFDVILKTKNRRRIYLPIPLFVGRVMAFFLEALPFPPLITRDQIKLLSYDNISTKGFINLKRIVRNPTSLQSIAETYL